MTYNMPKADFKNSHTACLNCKYTVLENSEKNHDSFLLKKSIKRFGPEINNELSNLNLNKESRYIGEVPTKNEFPEVKYEANYLNSRRTGNRKRKSSIFTTVSPVHDFLALLRIKSSQYPDRLTNTTLNVDGAYRQVEQGLSHLRQTCW
ncbi:hypothetical protein LOAG_01007 [Loa loa]|uniref:Uncharacterized protein n=1 Tax=Loa loa TaxID=7209 RepID=A0A1S0UC23_LOALO|nr:hypothetical protein LOAG_01007 [Loa loa]EFO27476.1 hypothetical protein LOAG_01007 [Loa loa]